MLVTVEGVYKEGKIELSETPDQVREAHVLVTFLMPENGRQQTAKHDMTAGEERGQQVLSERVLQRMETGYHLGGPPYPDRESLYERTDRYS